MYRLVHGVSWFCSYRHCPQSRPTSSGACVTVRCPSVCLSPCNTAEEQLWRSPLAGSSTGPRTRRSAANAPSAVIPQAGSVYIGWQWRNFVSYLCQLIFCRHLVGKTLKNVCHCDIAYIRFVGKSVIIWTFSLNTDSILFRWHDKSSPFNSTHHVVLYPQNGDRIVTIYYVTSLHPVYTVKSIMLMLPTAAASRWPCCVLCSIEHKCVFVVLELRSGSYYHHHHHPFYFRQQGP